MISHIVDRDDISIAVAAFGLTCQTSPTLSEGAHCQCPSRSCQFGAAAAASSLPNCWEPATTTTQKIFISCFVQLQQLQLPESGLISEHLPN